MADSKAEETLLPKNMSESEEDGEIEVEETSLTKDTPFINTEEHESDSSKEDAGDDSLDIKPPQASVSVSKDSSDRRERKKSRHSHKHYSRRKERRRSRERNAPRDSHGFWPSDSHKRGSRDSNSRRHHPRENVDREKEREAKEQRESRDHRESSEFKKTRNIQDSREDKEPREAPDRGERSRDLKEKDSRELDRLEEKKWEWRKKRLLFIQQQQLKRNSAQEESDWKHRGSDDSDWKHRGGNQGSSLRSKTSRRNVLDRSRPRDRSRSPMKESISSDKPLRESGGMKTTYQRITPEHYHNEVMEDVDDEEVDEQESEAEQHSEDEEGEDYDDKKDASESDSDSSSSESEESSHSSETDKDDKGSDEDVVMEDAKSDEAEEVKETVKVKTEPAVTLSKPASPPKPQESQNLPVYLPAVQGCRSVEEFHCLNRIEEGTYGVVYRARDKRTDEIVALKRLKMEKEKEGFPITSLREINTLLKAQHPNIVTVREIVVGSNMDKIYIVMDYVEHDLKSLMETMKQPFLIGEVKTLMLQLLQAVAHLHDNWILHRDLKTSNLLLSHKGILKVGDFGLAREYGSPLKPYTPVVVTLWYRTPELLLGIKEYSTPIDLWSVGCIFGELLTMKPLFPGKSEIDQLNRIFKDLGTPSEKIWPGYSELPMVKKVTFTEYPYNNLRSRFSNNFTDLGFDLLNRFLTYNPTRRITAEDALSHEFFKETPKPVSPSMFPTWPAKSEQVHRKAQSPKPPSGGKQYARQMGDADDEGLITNSAGFHMGVAQEGHSAKGGGFSLKF